MTDKILKYGQYFFTAIFGAVLLIGIYRGIEILVDGGVSLLASIFIFIGAAALVYLLVKILRFMYDKFAVISDKKTHIIFGCLCIGVLAFQIFCAVTLKTDRPYPEDLQIVDRAARILAEDFNPENLKVSMTVYSTHDTSYSQNIWEYMQYYTLNIPVTCLLTACYKLGFSPIWLNTFFLFGTYVLTCLSAAKIFSDNFRFLMVAVIGAIFPVFYGYTTIYYTDTMSIFWVILTIYLLICGATEKRGKLIFRILAALSLAVGFMVKGTVGILLPAVLIWLFFQIKDFGFKKVFAFGCVFAVSFGVFAAAFSYAVDKTGITTPESRDVYEHPKTHWIMMGLLENGGYSIDDVNATRAAGNYAEKTEFNIKVIKERLGNYNFFSYLKLLFYGKAARTWLDGAYFINQGYLDSKFINSKAFVGLTMFNQLLLFTGLICSFYFGGKFTKRDFTLLFRIALCGLFIFLLIWETRSRYIINFTPLILLLFPSFLSDKTENVRVTL